MKVSLTWLQKYFTEPLPDVEVIHDALTFHSSEVEEVIGTGDNTVLDIKVLPDRAAYGLSHRGIAYELAAALDLSLENDPLRTELPVYPATGPIKVSIKDSEKCARYMSALVTGVTVGPSPEWLRVSLERIGQRSINNVVDATNYVMLNIGQPLHAFDAGKLSKDSDGSYQITVRGASEGEKITTLTNEEYALPEGTLLITDAGTNTPLGIAGIKGGKAAQIDESTKDILIESANFEGTSTRKTSQTLKLWTDASLRFQNKISPELAAYGMRDVIALILEIAGGEFVAVVDTYLSPEAPQSPVSITRDQLNNILGTNFSMDDITAALTRLSLTFAQEGEMVMVQPSFERRDIAIWQDLAEEIGRVVGYDQVAPTPLPAMTEAPDQSEWRGIEAIKDILIDRGFTEISTQSFAATGETLLANPLQSDKPWLRARLTENMEDALARAAQVAPRVLGPEPMIKLFELGTVFKKDSEHFSLCIGYTQLTGKTSQTLLAETVDAILEAFPDASIARLPGGSAQVVELSLANARLETIGTAAQPARMSLSEYRSFSSYPSALRDIAVWTTEGTSESELALIIQKEAGDLLARMDLFDRFEKDGRTSYAFRLVFQSFDRTLSDADLDPIMERITTDLNKKNSWTVR